MRIALTGSMFSGKTSLADMLESDYGWTKLNYTDRIKVQLGKALSAIHGRTITATEIAKDKGKYRRLLQDLGSYLGYNEGFDVETLVHEWLATQRSVTGSYESNVVWDCVRFKAQADILRDNGFTIVELDVDLSQQQHRAFLKGINAEKLHDMMGHEAEIGVEWDMALDGNRPTEELAEVLARLSGSRRIKPAEKPIKLYVGVGSPASLGLN